VNLTWEAYDAHTQFGHKIYQLECVLVVLMILLTWILRKEDVVWIGSGQGAFEWWALVDTIINILDPQKSGNFLTT
jgi:hypothetical protein